MKNLFAAIITVTTLTLSSCGKSDSNALPAAYENDSWRCYAQKYSVDFENPSDEEINAYLDWYVGSVEEEKDMTKTR